MMAKIFQTTINAKTEMTYPTLLPLNVHQQLMVMEFFVLFFFTKRQSNQNKCYKHSSF